jgi:hypothetical protein
MLTHFVLTSFAALIGWQILRSAVWFRIPGRLAPVLVLLISYAFTWYFSYPFLLAFAATGGCAVLLKVIDAEGIEPWTFPKVTWKKNTRAWPPGSGGQPKSQLRSPRIGRRSSIGARIPPL